LSHGRKRRFVFVSILTNCNIKSYSMCHIIASEKFKVKKFPAFYETQILITAFKHPTTCHYPVPDQSNPTAERSISILSSHLHLDSKRSLSLRFPHQKPVYTSPIVPNTPRIWRVFGSALPFQTRLTQTKSVLPLPNEHGSPVKDQGRWQCCHTKHKNFPIDLHVLYRYFPDKVILG
jgi:hypothetical protein